MKPVWGIIAFAIVFSVAGLVMIFKGKVEVDPLRVLNPTNFSSPEEVGAVTFRRFWAEITSGKLVIIATSPHVRDSARIWKGFLAVAREYKVTFREIYAQEGLPPLFDPLASTILGSTAPPVRKLDWEKVQIALAGDGKVLVHIAATDEMWRAVHERTRDALAIFQSLLPVEERAKSLLESECKNTNSDSVSIAKSVTPVAPSGATPPADMKIACLSLEALSHGKKKKFDPTKLTATIEKHGKSAHILFVHEPL